MYIVYGIKNCNTVKKALNYLDAHKIAYQFHDYKKEGINETKLKDWCKQIAWEKLVNKQGTTWRQLGESIQQNITTEKNAIALMQEKTSVIKRPLIELENKVFVLGFDEATYEAIKWA